MKMGFGGGGGRETRSKENGNTYHICGSLKNRNSLEDLAVDRRAIMKIISNKHIVRREVSLCGTRVRAGFRKHRDELPVYMK